MTKKEKIFYIIILIFFTLGIFLPFKVKAIIEQDCSQYPEYTSKVCFLLERIASVLYIIAGTLALIMLLIGGISIMTAGGNEQQLNKGKKTITAGLIGAAIVFSAGFILELLNEFLTPLVL